MVERMRSWSEGVPMNSTNTSGSRKPKRSDDARRSLSASAVSAAYFLPMLWRCAGTVASQLKSPDSVNGKGGSRSNSYRP